ncbi:MAG: sigma-54-dependent Fis family transcriptional regulator, partial [Rhodoferax sp.]|nr:sigma-54-dependent Fis family transcriptional regulator [Rhodoferax sp.]
KAMIAQGTFREDLYYRVNVFPIHSPPLRERRDDIPALAFHFLKLFCNELERPVSEISEAAMSMLTGYDWPGNVRELQSTMQRAVILASDSAIHQAHLVNIIESLPKSDLEVPRTSEDLKRVKKLVREKSVEDVEKLFIQETLKRNGFNVTKSAEETGMQRSNFQALMKKYNIRVRDTEYDPDES